MNSLVPDPHPYGNNLLLLESQTSNGHWQKGQFIKKHAVIVERLAF